MGGGAGRGQATLSSWLASRQSQKKNNTRAWHPRPSVFYHCLSAASVTPACLARAPEAPLLHTRRGHGPAAPLSNHMSHYDPLGSTEPRASRPSVDLNWPCGHRSAAGGRCSCWTWPFAAAAASARRSQPQRPPPTPSSATAACPPPGTDTTRRASHALLKLRMTSSEHEAAMDRGGGHSLTVSSALLSAVVVG